MTKRRSNSLSEGFEIPIPERVIEFNLGEYRSNPHITGIDESLITESDYKDFAENALVFTDGNIIYQYAEEYPICYYYCSNKSMLQPENFLNTFIESISVSIADYGKKVSVGTGKVVEKLCSMDAVVYYTDRIGIKHAVVQNDIIKFLLKKPKLLVSTDGVLVFYTAKEILATIDCNHYAWVGIDGNPTIRNLSNDGKFVIVSRVSGRKKDKIKFTIDLLNHSALLYDIVEESD